MAVMNKIRQIVRLKQVMQRWRRSSSSHVIPMEVGPDRNRFNVPARFMNLPIIISLLNQARDEFGGYQPPNSVLSLPTCDPRLFHVIIDFLNIDEVKYGRLEIKDFAKFIAKTETTHDFHSSQDSGPVKPLLQMA